MPISLVLADDRPFELLGLEQFLASKPGFAILAACTDGEETLLALRQHRPDILILDLHLPRVDGLALLCELRNENLLVKPIVLTGAAADDEVLEAIRLGARGVIRKELSPHFLIQCIHKVYNGGTWLETQSTGRVLDKLLRHEAGTEEIAKVLTPREIDLVRLVAQGLDNTAITLELHISENTVKVHLHRIYRKLELKNRVSLLLYAQSKVL
jgi:DNA-binding NarL/FixJ family response regulator